jgi:cellobiose transport system permease protein
VLGSANPTLPVPIQLLQAFHFKDYSLILAGVTVVAAALIVVFLFAGRQRVAGVMRGQGLRAGPLRTRVTQHRFDAPAFE